MMSELRRVICLAPSLAISLLSIYAINSIEIFLISILIFVITLKFSADSTRTREINKEFIGALIILFLILFPMLLSWESLFIRNEICPIPSFGIYPQHLRNEGNTYNLFDLGYAENPEDSRGYYRKLRELRDEVAAENIPNIEMTELSMGMSDDYEVAVEEGATLVRVGSAIFGARDYA